MGGDLWDLCSIHCYLYKHQSGCLPNHSTVTQLCYLAHQVSCITELLGDPRPTLTSREAGEVFFLHLSSFSLPRFDASLLTSFIIASDDAKSG